MMLSARKQLSGAKNRQQAKISANWSVHTSHKLLLCPLAMAPSTDSTTLRHLHRSNFATLSANTKFNS